MKFRMLSLVALAAVLCTAIRAQDPTAPSSPQAPGDSQRGQGGGGRGFGRGMMGQRGVMGTVTEVTPDHFTIKNDAGEMWTIHYSANTRIMKQPPRQARPEGQGSGAEAGSWQPQAVKAPDIKAGDVIMAMGERDEAAKSVGAMMVMQVDPERARQMREMQANFGKTWLMGRVSAISETKITLHSGVDNADHTFVVDENTSFRRRRDPVTLADVQVGDNIRVDGAIKDGQFVATTLNVMMPLMQGGPARRQGPPPQ
jgi:preprotein translocase subunit YajC